MRSRRIQRNPCRRPAPTHRPTPQTAICCRPPNYREWIYLTTGIDMSYSPNAMQMDHSMFDNVFVNPAAYRSFLATGTWPDKTVMVLEVRGAKNKGRSTSAAISRTRPSWASKCT